MNSKKLKLKASIGGQIVTVECTFVASVLYTNNNLPNETAVSEHKSGTGIQKNQAATLQMKPENITFQTAGMIAVICIIQSRLIAAVIPLMEEEVERDAFRLIVQPVIGELMQVEKISVL